MHGCHVSPINCTFHWSHKYWMFPQCPCRIWATSVNSLCGHQFCVGYIVMQWIQCVRMNTHMDEFDWPVCCQSLPRIIERLNQIRENTPFWEDSKTQHLIIGLIEEVTEGINKYGDEIECLGGKDGCNTLKESEDAITHCEIIQLWVHYLNMMTDIPDFGWHFSVYESLMKWFGSYWLNLDSIVLMHCTREPFDLLQSTDHEGQTLILTWDSPPPPEPQSLTTPCCIHARGVIQLQDSRLVHGIERGNHC